MDDQIDDLRAILKFYEDGHGAQYGALLQLPPDMLRWAITEIERLRSLSGAVSPGPSFDQIRRAPPFQPVLKAFDGA